MNEEQQKYIPYGWEGESLAKAQAEGKPLRITIDLRRSPQDPMGATSRRLTQRYFIPVYVDADLHPDVAAVYVRAAELLTGRSSLPLEVLADGDGSPFFISGPLSEVELAGLLSGVALHWSSDPAPYRRTGALLRQRLARAEPLTCGARSLCQLRKACYEGLSEEYETDGGFDLRSPRPQRLLFLMDYARRTGEALPMELAERGGIQLALSAVRDHVGGGFFRGAEDPQGTRPIPEKRLKDQAWLLELYLRLWQGTGTELFRRVAAETADYVIRELRREQGGFYEGQRLCGKEYLLTAQEVCDGPGETDGEIFCRQYAVGEVPCAPHLLQGETPTEDTPLLHSLRMQLYRRRLERAVPQREETLLLGENGLMIAALARAGCVLGAQRYLTAAADAEESLRSRMVFPTRLHHYCHNGAVGGEGTMGDYAGYAKGLLGLYRCGCGGEYLAAAARLMVRADALFSDHAGGGWFSGRGDRLLPLRSKELEDRELPSDWSVALEVLGVLCRELPHGGLRSRTKALMDYAVRTAVPQRWAYGLTVLPNRL